MGAPGDPIQVGSGSKTPQHGAATMKRTYKAAARADKRAVRECLKRERQFLLPMLELVEQTELAIDEVLQVMGRARRCWR